ncbi:hypothetical protein RM572_21765 [Streptomyces sp. DSM 42041]|uniref:DNA-binding phage zinc finger domain-containing protein n=1 Tax=Streptomyces hazeniae TaxID=3075538 RepID=A0ABU2NWM2_9ACTN|nr:hypothetical protein [Streptomyces sp. DSM 42041]MDT0381389.1 hypothetical protein [Streptomyces sp. DSM 42041]
MTLDEVYDLFKQISLVDDRVVRTDPAELTAQANLWAAALINVPLEFAGEALGRHYAACPYAVKPSDIAEQWRSVARDRMAQHTERSAPAHDPDDVHGYRDALRAGRAAVAAGHQQPAAVGELTRGPGPDFVPATPGFLAAKAAMWPEEQRPERPVELAVHCTWCGASANRPCRTKSRQRPMQGVHPSRRDVYAAAQIRNEEQGARSA